MPSRFAAIALWSTIFLCFLSFATQVYEVPFPKFISAILDTVFYGLQSLGTAAFEAFVLLIQFLSGLLLVYLLIRYFRPLFGASSAICCFLLNAALLLWQLSACLCLQLMVFTHQFQVRVNTQRALQLRNWESEVIALSNDNNTLSADNNTLSAEVGKLQLNLKDWKEKYRVLDLANVTSSNLSMSWKREYGAARKEINNLRSHIQHLESNNRSMKWGYERVIAGLKDNNTTDNNEQVDSHPDKLSASEKSLKSANDELSTTKISLAKITQELEHTKELLKSEQEKDKQPGLSVNETTELQARVSSAEKEIATLTQSLHEARTLADALFKEGTEKIGCLEGEVAKHQSALAQGEIAHNITTAALNNARANMSSTEKKLSAANNSNGELRATLGAKAKALKVADTALKAYSSLNGDMDTLTTAFGDFRAKTGGDPDDVYTPAEVTAYIQNELLNVFKQAEEYQELMELFAKRQPNAGEERVSLETFVLRACDTEGPHSQTYATSAGASQPQQPVVAPVTPAVAAVPAATDASLPSPLYAYAQMKSMQLRIQRESGGRVVEPPVLETRTAQTPAMMLKNLKGGIRKMQFLSEKIQTNITNGDSNGDLTSETIEALNEVIRMGQKVKKSLS